MPSSQQGQGRGLTRNRERLACIECRRRKLKCDRQLPCGACARRKDAQNCCFQRFANGSGGGTKDPRRQAQLEDRLSYLEQVVQNVAPLYALSGPPDISITRQSMSMGAAAVDYGDATLNTGNGTPNNGMANGATHWSSVCDDIHELSPADTHETEPSPTITDDNCSCVGILFGKSKPTTMKAVVDTFLPLRQEIDRYVSAYFKTQVIAAGFLHSSQFQRLYQEFWSDPSKASPLWTSILFSMCDISRNSLDSAGETGARDERFAQAAAHCLVAGEYFRPQTWALEALLIFAQARCLSSAVLSPDVAPIFALASRVATMMGYHRKPESMGIGPFAAEMRRRIWAMLTQLDLLVSFHLGLFSSIPGPLTEVEPPRNLDDSDLDEHQLELPVSRPIGDSTCIQFVVAKHHFMGVFDKILRAALESQQNLVSLDRVQELHDEVESLFSSMPDTLKPRPMTESIFDSTMLVVTRLSVMFIYTKSICVLHRPYVLHRRLESIQACYDASTMLTSGLCDAYHEFGPGGQAKSEPWFISSLTWHDFLLGTVSLCLSALIGTSSASDEIVDVEATYQLLSKISTICTEQGDARGIGTKRVRQIVEATMERLQSTQKPDVACKENNNVENGFDGSLGQGWIGSMPEPLEDALWDEYMGHYLNLDMLLSS